MHKYPSCKEKSSSHARDHNQGNDRELQSASPVNTEPAGWTAQTDSVTPHPQHVPPILTEQLIAFERQPNSSCLSAPRDSDISPSISTSEKAPFSTQELEQKFSMLSLSHTVGQSNSSVQRKRKGNGLERLGPDTNGKVPETFGTIAVCEKSNQPGKTVHAYLYRVGEKKKKVQSLDGS